MLVMVPFVGGRYYYIPVQAYHPFRIMNPAGCLRCITESTGYDHFCRQTKLAAEAFQPLQISAQKSHPANVFIDHGETSGLPLVLEGAGTMSLRVFCFSEMYCL